MATCTKTTSWGFYRAIAQQFLERAQAHIQSLRVIQTVDGQHDSPIGESRANLVHSQLRLGGSGRLNQSRRVDRNRELVHPNSMCSVHKPAAYQSGVNQRPSGHTKVAGRLTFLESNEIGAQ